MLPWPVLRQSPRQIRPSNCLHEQSDNLTAGFGAEIAAVLAKETFFDLDAPIERLTMPDTPNPHNINLLNAVVPSVEKIQTAMNDLMEI